MPEGPMNEVTKLREDKRGNSIVYTLRVKAMGIKSAKVKARMWSRVNNPFSSSISTVIQVMDPDTGAVLEGGSDFTIDWEDLDDDDKPEIEGIAMRDTFDIMVGVRK